jgi:hypothetical protein
VRKLTWMSSGALAGLLLVTASCDSLGGLTDVLNPRKTTVRLENNSDTFDVHVVLYYGDDQNVLEALFTNVGTRREFTIAPNDVEQFSLDCDALQAIMIDKAELQVIGSIGPEDGTGVYRDGSDFNCRDTLVFTFDGQLLPPDLNISFSTK